MGWHFVKQPNGLLARFNSITDGLDCCSLTPEQALAQALSEGLSEAEAHEKVKAGLEDWKPFTRGALGSGEDRWNHALRTLQSNHGAEAVAQAIALGSAEQSTDHPALQAPSP